MNTKQNYFQKLISNFQFFFLKRFSSFTTKRLFAVLCFLSFSFEVLPPLNAETQPPEPEPYQKEEFPLWARELRRFEILSFGAMPLVTMLSFWTYDIFRSIKHHGDKRYYPWPIKKAAIAVPLTEKEQRNIFFTAVGISVGIALTDICVRAIIRSAREKKEARENIIEESPIQLLPIEEKNTK